METVKLHGKGESVKVLEHLLTRVGYAGLSMEGIFDEILAEKVKKFQSLRDMKVDGVVGDKTWTAIFEAVKLKKPRMEGVDISHHENDALRPLDIGWAQLNRSFWFCYVKATQGQGYKDPKFGHNIEQLSKHNILRSGYHFMDFFAEKGVKSEIKNFLEYCNLDWSAKGILPPCLDVEPTRSGDWALENRIFNEKDRIIDNINIWLEAVKKDTGREPIIYTSRRIWDDILGGASGFENYLLWVANYRRAVVTPGIPKAWKGEYAIWQYSEDGAVGNMKGFDVNILNIPLQDLYKLGNY